MECLRVKLNLSQIWLRGFKLATNHYCYHSNNFWIDNFLKNAQKLCALQHWWKLPFEIWWCLKSQEWVTPSTRMKEFCFFLRLFLSYSSNNVKGVSFIVIHSVASFDATQKMWLFLAPWCRELSNDIKHEWFCSDHFLTLLYVKCQPIMIRASCYCGLQGY